jgi:hypothetical protein
MIDIFLLKKYHLWKIPSPPFYDKHSAGYLEIVGPEALLALNQHMGGIRHTLTTQYRYMVMLNNYRFFLDGYSAQFAKNHFHVPINTVKDHYKIFEGYTPEVNNFYRKLQRSA